MTRRLRRAGLGVGVGIVAALGWGCPPHVPPPPPPPERDHAAMERMREAACTPAKDPEALIRCITALPQDKGGW